MKINIDTEKHQIILEENVNLGEFMEWIKHMLRDGQWKDYDLVRSKHFMLDYKDYTPSPNPYFRPYYYNTDKT